MCGSPCFQVGVGDAPLPGRAQVLLATFTMLVQDPYPITLTVEPVNHPSIPGEMAYLTNDEPQEIRELYSSTGEPAVAWINQGMPGAVIEPSEVDYQEVAVGYSETRIVTVHNPGGGPLVLDIGIEGSDPSAAQCSQPVQSHDRGQLRDGKNRSGKNLHF